MRRLEQLLEMLKDSPGDSFLRFGVAKEYEGNGDSDKALEYYLAILQDDPSYVGLYYHLGMLYEQQEEYQKALHAYKEGIAQANSQGDLHAKSELMSARTNLEIEMD